MLVHKSEENSNEDNYICTSLVANVGISADRHIQRMYMWC